MKRQTTRRVAALVTLAALLSAGPALADGAPTPRPETEMGKLAASLKPGEMKRLETKGYAWDLMKSWYDWETGLRGAHKSYSIICWSNDANWDPASTSRFGPAIRQRDSNPSAQRSLAVKRIVPLCILAMSTASLFASGAEPGSAEVRAAQADATVRKNKLTKQCVARDAYGREWQDRGTPGPAVRVFGGHRQPAIVLTNQGTLLAFGEQYTSAGDTGDHEIVLRRSTDGGETWGEQIVVFDDGRKNLNGPTPVVDRATGTVWLMFARSCKDLLLTHSKDDDTTATGWSSAARRRVAA